LARMQVKAFYEPLNDISTPDGKIGGAAQKRLAAGSMLHHVTMSYDIDAQKMTEVLRIGREKISDKDIVSAQARVDPLRRQTGMTRADIWDVMVETFAESYDATTREVSTDELRRAEALAEEKFMKPEWIRRVPSPRPKALPSSPCCLCNSPMFKICTAFTPDPTSRSWGGGMLR